MKNDLERLSGILKGILLYKQEQEILKELIKKYKLESAQILMNEHGYGICTAIG